METTVCSFDAVLVGELLFLQLRQESFHIFGRLKAKLRGGCTLELNPDERWMGDCPEYSRLSADHPARLVKLTFGLSDSERVELVGSTLRDAAEIKKFTVVVGARGSQNGLRVCAFSAPADDCLTLAVPK